MDKNNFFLGGRLFNTASPRLGAPTQRKARPQVGRPNATSATQTEGTSATQTEGTSAMQTEGTSASPEVGRPNAMQGTSAIWAPQRTSATQGTSTRPQVGRPNARLQRKRKACQHVCKLGAPTQRKARSRDGRPNEKLIHNENVHTREH